MRLRRSCIFGAILLQSTDMFLMQKYGKPMDIVYRPSERNHVLKDEFLSIGAEYDEHNALMRFRPDTIRDYDWATVKEGDVE